MPFQFNRKTQFLTYSQVQDVDFFLEPRSGHLDFLSDLFGTPQWYRMGKEYHADGGTHFHVAVRWRENIQSRNERIFDFGGVHPKVEPIRQPRKAWDYVAKQGDVIHEHGEPSEESVSASRKRDALFQQALSAESLERFLDIIKEGATRDFVLYNRAIRECGEFYFSGKCEPYASPTFDCDPPEELRIWLDAAGIGDESAVGRRRSLILWGPSRTGKTVWARSLGKTLPKPL